MSNLDKYLDRIIVPKTPTGEKTPPVEIPQMPSEDDSDGPSAIDMVKGVFRRWYILLAVFILICLPSLPAIWLLMEPVYTVRGTIKVEPIMNEVLSGDAESLGGTQVYESFINTEAQMVLNNQIVQKVADGLSNNMVFYREYQTSPLITKLKQKLNIYTPIYDILEVLKQAIRDGIITSTTARRSQFIEVTMKYKNETEAQKIVNLFIDAFFMQEKTFYDSSITTNLETLQKELDDSNDLIVAKQNKIKAAADVYGSKNLTERQMIKLQRVASLRAELTDLETKKENLDMRITLLKDSNEVPVNSSELVRMRQEYVNNDQNVRMSLSNIAELENSLLEPHQAYTEIDRKNTLLTDLKDRLVEQKKEAGESFDNMIKEQKARMKDVELANAEKERDEIEKYIERLKIEYHTEDNETIEIGQKQLAIQRMEEELANMKELYATINRRIQIIVLESKRPGRIQKGSSAQVTEISDKRIKLSLAAIFGSLAFGAFLAFLKDKADHSLWTAEDITKRIGLKIIGTTTSSHTVKAASLQDLVVEDYQTIRANLGLLTGGGLPRKLAVVSPAMKEGKTTFAINLATSIAWSGKSVLLIDGDLRKPDIGQLLGVPAEERKLYDVLRGKEIGNSAYLIPSTRLHVLAPDSEGTPDIFELIVSPKAAQYIDAICQRYDHIIIDTPPVLAFPDALAWAKIAGAVVLTSFARQTKVQELKEAKDRLTRINVAILGTVLSNVEPDQLRYGHSYRDQARRNRTRKKMLLAAKVKE